jgi:hypothetical protein
LNPDHQRQSDKTWQPGFKSIIMPGERAASSNWIRKLLNAGADLLITAAGLSVDPVDVKRQTYIDASMECYMVLFLQV